MLPDIKGKVTAERELENHGGDAFKKADTFEAQFLVSWELDLWGNLRWARSASIAEYLQSIEAQRALRMTIVAEVAQAYYELVALDTELDIVKQTLKAREEGVRLARIRFCRRIDFRNFLSSGTSGVGTYGYFSSGFRT